MPCGTSRVVSTTPATTSLATHSRWNGERLRPRATVNIGPDCLAGHLFVITLRGVTAPRPAVMRQVTPGGVMCRPGQRPTMAPMDLSASPGGTRGQRWLARLSLLLACLAVLIVVVFAELKGIVILALGVVAAA